MCLLGVAKPKVKLLTLFALKTAILGPFYDGTQKFSLENAFNIGHVGPTK